ncbi:MAG TPA: hypothetical protein VJX29_10185 [Candidatus Acidoferrales bacterium]|nr:hypothetical protein [Candidatus Acidoferrales bacterium]
MRELILSEITRMAQGYCIIGLEPQGNAFRSVRPMPQRSHAWGHPWPHSRGDRLRFRLASLPSVRPHVEDFQAAGAPACTGRVAEGELLRCLRAAETGRKTEELFGSALQTNPQGGGAAWVNAREATRSICGCEFRFVRFHWKLDRWRAELQLTSGESLKSLPIVDRDWNDFLDEAAKLGGSQNPQERVRSFLNGPVAAAIWKDENRFARLGLARPNPQGVCWLMLDSLFPLQKREWLSKFAAGPGTT